MSTFNVCPSRKWCYFRIFNLVRRSLGEILLNVGAEGEQRAIDQIVWTLIEFAPEVKSVAFTVNGKTVESFAGHVDTTAAFERAIGYEVLNPIQISSINQGAELTSPVTISGQSCTFEANVVWRALTCRVQKFLDQKLGHLAKAHLQQLAHLY